ncbi:MAG TPA: hypothetical protein VNA25_02370, partial [Phycisphaerae bacterium]|nr:hypothetical protein [Phycisphaerae bacterium]
STQYGSNYTETFTQAAGSKTDEGALWTWVTEHQYVSGVTVKFTRGAGDSGEDDKLNVGSYSKPMAKDIDEVSASSVVAKGNICYGNTAQTVSAGTDLRLALTGTDGTGGTGSMAIQVVGLGGEALAARARIRTWIAEASYSEPDPQTGFTVTTGELLRPIEANADLEVITDATGLALMAIDAGGAKTVHVMAELDGQIYTASLGITA